MRKMRIMVCAAAGLGFAVAAMASDDELNVYNWSDYIGENTIAEFEAETGIKVRYDVFDSNDILETKLLAGRSGYDVVVPSGNFLARQVQAGAFQPLDRTKLQNWGNLSPDIMDSVARAWDPDNRHGIVYMWGTTGIGYNVEKIAERMPDAPVDSLRMLFDPDIVARFADCGIHVLDAVDEVLPAALAYIGEKPDSKDPDILRKAEPVLKAMRPHVTKFHSSEYINALANGDICLAFGWSGDVFQASDRAVEANNGVEIAYTIPEEGALMWMDMMAIPNDAPNPEAAHLFIDYIMRPRVIAEATNYVYYANANPPSDPMIEPEIREDPAIYPTSEVMQKLYINTPYEPAEQRLINRIWTRVKTGR